MPNEGQKRLIFPNNTSDLYALFIRSDGTWWNNTDGVLEDYTSGNYAEYAVDGAAQGPVHVVTVPDALPMGRYAVTVCAAASPATSDAPIASLQMEITWDPDWGISLH